MSLFFEIVENIFMTLVDYRFFQGLSASLALAVAWPVAKAVVRLAIKGIRTEFGKTAYGCVTSGVFGLVVFVIIATGSLGSFEVDALATSLAPFVGLEVAAALFSIFMRGEGYLEISDELRLITRIISYLMIIAAAVTFFAILAGVASASNVLLVILIWQLLVAAMLWDIIRKR